ncbi:MAG TPA: amidohydrolase family protein [Acidimicrobiales bacterium]
MSTTTADRYTIISSDCHAGGNHAQYREYLDPAWLDEFDAWRGRYKNPFRDLQDDGRSRNWDDERRITEMDADGIVGEVVFPNTVPPFFPTGVVIAPAPTAEEFPARLAGIRAHNRWLADFCAAHPTRRAGLGQILLNDVDEAVADIRWAKDHGLSGVLLPGVAPNTGIDPLYAPTYDPIWAVCQELEFPVTHHGGGSGVPDMGRFPASMTMYILEVGFYANRALWHLIMSGVFDRFPELVFVMTEQGTGWIPDALDRMDSIHDSMVKGKFGGELGPAAMQLPRPPSEYFAEHCYVGASFPSADDVNQFERIGLDRVMWGSDYPHREGTYPYSKESLRLSFAGWDEATLRRIFAENVAKVYGFDLGALDAIAAECGPLVAEVAEPLEVIPTDATSPAFFRP